MNLLKKIKIIWVLTIFLIGCEVVKAKPDSEPQIEQSDSVSKTGSDTQDMGQKDDTDEHFDTHGIDIASVPWILTAQQAQTEIEHGALLLDIRSESDFKQKHIPGSVHITWQMFSKPAPDSDRGRLLDDNALQQPLKKAGIMMERSVIVVGDPVGGWGEDGRIVWMLRTLGHADAALVDGGFKALEAQMVKSSTGAVPNSQHIIIERNVQWDIKAEEIASLMKAKDVVLVDTRELREYEGQTPYGESRAGHVPGAVHLYFKDLIDEKGFLLEEDKLLGILAEKGISADKTIVAYCTGGVRSGWFVAVLTYLGFDDVRNYAGSMWEWASLNPEQYMLETK